MKTTKKQEQALRDLVDAGREREKRASGAPAVRPAQTPDAAERLELIRSWWIRDHHMAWPGDTWGDVQSLAALLRARDEATIERDARVAEAFKEHLEVDEHWIADDIARAIRALKKPGGPAR